MKNIILKVLAIILCVGTILTMVIKLFDISSEVSSIISSITILSFLFSIPMLCCASLYDKSERKELSAIGLILCSLTFLYFVGSFLGIITINLFDSSSLKMLVVFLLITLSISHLCFVMSFDSSLSNVHMCQTLTIIVSIIYDLYVIIKLLIGTDASSLLVNATTEDMSSKITFILSMAITLGTIMTVLLSLVNEENSSSMQSYESYNKLEQLETMLTNNVITQEQFEIERVRILNEDNMKY